MSCDQRREWRAAGHDGFTITARIRTRYHWHPAVSRKASHEDQLSVWSLDTAEGDERCSKEWVAFGQRRLLVRGRSSSRGVARNCSAFLFQGSFPQQGFGVPSGSKSKAACDGAKFHCVFQQISADRKCGNASLANCKQINEAMNAIIEKESVKMGPQGSVPFVTEEKPAWRQEQQRTVGKALGVAEQLATMKGRYLTSEW